MTEVARGSIAGPGAVAGAEARAGPGAMPAARMTRTPVTIGQTGYDVKR